MLVTSLFVITAIGLGRPAGSFYILGMAPREYEEGAQLELKVNKLTSSKAQLPYGYCTMP